MMIALEPIAEGEGIGRARKRARASMREIMNGRNELVPCPPCQLSSLALLVVIWPREISVRKTHIDTPIHT